MCKLNTTLTVQRLEAELRYYHSKYPNDAVQINETEFLSNVQYYIIQL